MYTEKERERERKEKKKKKSTRETEIRNREPEKMKTGWYANVSILSKFIAKGRVKDTGVKKTVKVFSPFLSKFRDSSNDSSGQGYLRKCHRIS